MSAEVGAFALKDHRPRAGPASQPRRARSRWLSERPLSTGVRTKHVPSLAPVPSAVACLPHRPVCKRHRTRSAGGTRPAPGAEQTVPLASSASAALSSIGRASRTWGACAAPTNSCPRRDSEDNSQRETWLVLHKSWPMAGSNTCRDDRQPSPDILANVRFHVA